MVIEFFVAGIPRPGGSKRAFYVKQINRAVITDAGGEKTKEWRASVVQAAADAMTKLGLPLLTGPLKLAIRFQFPRPKSHYGTGKRAGTLKPSAPELHITKPDTTKLVRSTEDALKGIVWRDDSQVALQIARKVYTDADLLGEKLPGVAGALVTIEELK